MASANTDLSLAKLRRATDPGSVSDYTTLSRLGADCAGATTNDTNYSISNFSIDSVDNSLTGMLWVDEQTSETYTMTFGGAGSRFTSRIASNGGNFTWTTASSSFAVAAGSDYTAVYTAAEISNVSVPNTVGDGTPATFYAAHVNDVDVEISGKYWDDGVSDGFNDHATRYNTAITKTVGVEDTYAGATITCFLPETPVELEDGEIIPIEDLVVGDKIKSYHIENLPDETLGKERYREFHLEEMNGELGDTEVKNVWFDFNPGYLDINEGLIKVTSEHEFWVLNKTTKEESPYMPPISKWGFKKAAKLEVGDILFGKEELIEIESIEYHHTEVEVVNINVEPVDVYFVNNILVHNKGQNSDPG
tara:strand:+ start:207 stop:1295 length:1089 start_codon:yes stop_codon:yes gene_type:complete